MYMRHIVKIIDAVGLLRAPGGATIRQMETSLGVSRRTVYRLLDALQTLGIPVYEEPSPEGREKLWRLEERYVRHLPNMDVPRIQLTEEERLLLAFLLEGAGVLHQTQLAAPLASLRGKLEAVLEARPWDPAVMDGLASLFVRSRPLGKDYAGKEELIESVVGAILSRTTCVVKYHALSTGKVREFRIDPLRMVEHRGGLYVFVRVAHYGDIRILAVDRIQALVETGARFERPSDFDAEALLESAFDLTFGDPVSVRIWFSSEAAPYVIERRWAARQETEPQADGSVILSMETSGFEDIKRWVLGYGPQAKVLEPAELALAVRDEARLAAAAYANGGA